MIKTLDKFAIGESGIVVKVVGERKIKRRLYDMGITNATLAIASLLEADDTPKLYMPNLEISTEMTLDEVIEYFCKE